MSEHVNAIVPLFGIDAELQVAGACVELIERGCYIKGRDSAELAPLTPEQRGRIARYLFERYQRHACTSNP